MSAKLCCHCEERPELFLSDAQVDGEEQTWKMWYSGSDRPAGCLDAVAPASGSIGMNLPVCITMLAVSSERLMLYNTNTPLYPAVWRPCCIRPDSRVPARPSAVTGQHKINQALLLRSA